MGRGKDVSGSNVLKEVGHVKQKLYVLIGVRLDVVQGGEDQRRRLPVFDEFLGIRVVDGRGVAHDAQSFQPVATLAFLRGRHREQRRKLERTRRGLRHVPFGPLEERVGQAGDGTEEELLVVAEAAEAVESPGYFRGNAGAQGQQHPIVRRCLCVPSCVRQAAVSLVQDAEPSLH